MAAVRSERADHLVVDPIDHVDADSAIDESALEVGTLSTGVVLIDM
jgi:hypothetical protein